MSWIGSQVSTIPFIRIRKTYENPYKQQRPPDCSSMQSIWSWSSNSKVFGVSSFLMRSPSRRKRRELDWTPFRVAYVSKTFDIFVDFLILKKVSSPVYGCGAKKGWRELVKIFAKKNTLPERPKNPMTKRVSTIQSQIDH